jgi:hypothetical protein
VLTQCKVYLFIFNECSLFEGVGYNGRSLGVVPFTECSLSARFIYSFSRSAHSLNVLDTTGVRSGKSSAATGTILSLNVLYSTSARSANFPSTSAHSAKFTQEESD